MAHRNSNPPVSEQRLHRLTITRREADVLHLVLQLYANPEIATHLGISKRTVESHVSALLRKFAVPDRTTLIRAALRLTDQTTPPHRPPTTPDHLSTARRRLAAQRQHAAQQRALQRDRDSITLHEHAAHHLDTLAATWEHHAHTSTDPTTRAGHLHHAATAHHHAHKARTRADQARQRLHTKTTTPTP